MSGKDMKGSRCNLIEVPYYSYFGTCLQRLMKSQDMWDRGQDTNTALPY